MALPKAGGIFTTILDASREKLGGGRSIFNRLLHDIGKGSHSKVQDAIFDGTFFYWIQETNERGGAPSWVIQKLALVGGDSSTLYQSAGALGNLERVGDRLVFLQREPQAAKKAGASAGKSKGISLGEQPFWAV